MQFLVYSWTDSSCWHFGQIAILVKYLFNFGTFLRLCKFLIDASLSNNTKVKYDKALGVFKNFRLQFNLPLSWPPSVDHVINFLAFLASRNLTHSTAKVYLSALSYNLQVHGLDNPVKSFIVQKMLAGLRRSKLTKDIRSPVTYQLLLKILNVLPTVTQSKYEHLLFGSAFATAFFGLFRIGEIAISSNKTLRNILPLSDLQLCNENVTLKLRFY